MRIILGRQEVCLSTWMKMTFVDHLGQGLKRCSCRGLDCYCRYLTLKSDVLGKNQICFVLRQNLLKRLDSQEDERKCVHSSMSSADLVISTASPNITIHPKTA